jgi:hypothetical protein
MPTDPGVALATADGALEIVEDQYSTAKPLTQPFLVDPVEMWTPRLDLYARARMWMPEWGPRPGQVGCSAPEELLEAYGIRRPGPMGGLSSGI